MSVTIARYYLILGTDRSDNSRPKERYYSWLKAKHRKLSRQASGICRYVDDMRDTSQLKLKIFQDSSYRLIIKYF